MTVICAGEITLADRGQSETERAKPAEAVVLPDTGWQQ